jgi:hypothetical protein
MFEGQLSLLAAFCTSLRIVRNCEMTTQLSGQARAIPATRHVITTLNLFSLSSIPGIY